MMKIVEKMKVAASQFSIKTELNASPSIYSRICPEVSDHFEAIASSRQKD